MATETPSKQEQIETSKKFKYGVIVLSKELDMTPHDVIGCIEELKFELMIRIDKFIEKLETPDKELAG